MILDVADLETARLCGRIGFDNVICMSDIHLLPEILLRIRNSGDTMVSLRDLSIVPDYNSTLVNNLLLFIERNYLTLSGVSELASVFRIHENTVIREFRKYNLPTPKQLLLKFKIFHSINIMKHNRLTIKEIACSSGFKDSKSLIRSFYKFYDCSPNVYYQEKIKKFQLVL
jgi:AraC-like DNA-binding protein